jgi:hypothetical protein
MDGGSSGNNLKIRFVWRALPIRPRVNMPESPTSFQFC